MRSAYRHSSANSLADGTTDTTIIGLNGSLLLIASLFFGHKLIVKKKSALSMLTCF